VQNREGFYWEEEDVNQRLFRKLEKAYALVAAMAKERKITMRQAAYCISLEKITSGMTARGVQ
jgi:glutamate dehydrogenase/leucine dehydrogenase